MGTNTAIRTQPPPGAANDSPAWQQQDLFAAVTESFAENEDLTNADLYADVAERLGLSSEECENARAAVGRDSQTHNLYHRRVRWIQQTLKRGSLLERVPGKRACWRVTDEGRQRLTRWTDSSASLIAFSTELGVAILGNCRSAFAGLDEPVTLCITSPPYPLAKPRAYGNERGAAYIDFICDALGPIVANLKSGGSVVLNVSNDIFESGSPARSLYRERLVLALHDRLGLSKMDELVWWNPSKPPGPTQWACKERQQLAVAWEPVYWFTNDPDKCDSDNRRVLETHTLRQQQLIGRGGESRHADFAGGAHPLRPGNFGRSTEGRIPRNVIQMGHGCPGAKGVNAYADANGLPRHGAPFPERLIQFFIEFLTRYDDLVVDPMCGTATVPTVAERLGRRWRASELVAEFLQAGAAARFPTSSTWFNPGLWSDHAPKALSAFEAAVEGRDRRGQRAGKRE